MENTLRIVFRNIDDTEFTRDAVKSALSRCATILESHTPCHTTVSITNEQSVLRDGPDSFRVRVFFRCQKRAMVIINKADSSMYVALDRAILELQERLTRQRHTRPREYSLQQHGPTVSKPKPRATKRNPGRR